MRRAQPVTKLSPSSMRQSARSRALPYSFQTPAAGSLQGYCSYDAPEGDAVGIVCIMSAITINEERHKQREREHVRLHRIGLGSADTPRRCEGLRNCKVRRLGAGSASWQA
jgi:hypothetical protein